MTVRNPRINDDNMDALAGALAGSMRYPPEERHENLANWQENLYQTRQELDIRRSPSDSLSMGSRDGAHYLMDILHRHARECNKFNGFVLIPRGRHDGREEIITASCICGRCWTEDFRMLEQMIGWRHGHAGIQEKIEEINREIPFRGVDGFKAELKIDILKEYKAEQKKQRAKKTREQNKKVALAKEARNNGDLIDSLGSDKNFLLE